MKLVVDNTQKLILGFGGAGCNLLSKLEETSPFARLYINTDDCKIETNPEQSVFFSAKRSLPVQLNQRCEEIKAQLTGYSEVFMLVGLGGQAGSSLSLAFASAARSMGVTVKGFVTLPFCFEGQRIERATQTLAALQKLGCSMFIYDHDLEVKDKQGSLQEHFDRAAEIALGLIR